ncbi:Uncharacterised protein [Candidatus Norongarragalina meridionalis]|nr:Uncharacterised protein [Candidatus Norongarragalina meridionalis]
MSERNPPAKRAQAAVFDGIMFLLLVSLSCTFVFVTVASYGQQEDQVMRSAYMLNYMQSVMKSVYFIDASTISNIKPDATLYPNLDCLKTKDYPGTVSVSDLVKRDVGDPAQTHPLGPALDDKFGTADSPGKTALRCSLEELMKPLSLSGYKYFSEFLDQRRPTAESPSGKAVTQPETRITNSILFAKLAEPAKQEGQIVQPSGCELAKNAGANVLSVASPFRVINYIGGGETSNRYIFRICVWQSNETAVGLGR